MSLIGKLYSIVVKRVGGTPSLVSVKVSDFSHESGAVTVTSVDKIDTSGTVDDAYRVEVAYPSTALPATSTTIANLVTTATDAVDAIYGATEGRVVPKAPTIGIAASAGETSATVAFTAPSDNGGSTITGYTAISTPGNISATGATSPITVTGLTTGVSYTFKVKATNAVGTGPLSAASNAAVPTA